MRNEAKIFALATLLYLMAPSCEGAPRQITANSQPLAYSCSAIPSVVLQGQTVAITGTVTNATRTDLLSYTWENWLCPPGIRMLGLAQMLDERCLIGSTGPKVTFETNGLQPGAYTVSGHVRDTREGRNVDESTDCSAQFVVMPAPLSISCTSNSSSVQWGEASTITVKATSLDNRPLSYSFAATDGAIIGSSSSATLSTAGAQSYLITVRCSVRDDQGHTASAYATVTVPYI